MTLHKSALNNELTHLTHNGSATIRPHCFHLRFFLHIHSINSMANTRLIYQYLPFAKR